ncbi:helix-turn-helix transcriptional regulator [Nocardia rhizosphaerihabitans]|uniref:Transcriptional regulator n=1 Tax=Nocardia rhizosphaerihabitans TaxID=1691570 RepID=A0ABQ2L4V1_9NOCA|nr:AraC family transcriptional regulator [Nocardia rhizosphaerihabitans]GGO00594.1 transcriptional regulator [Nocardia rhizosphaerihabitans]
MEISPVWAVPRGTEGVRIMVQAGVAHGVPAADCLTGTGLAEQDLDNEDAEIWAHQEFEVIRNLIAALGDRPGLGADVGGFSTLGRTGVIGFMMLAGPTFLDAVERAIPYLALSPTHLRFAIDVGENHAQLIASGSELPADVRTFIIERDLAGLAAALRGAHIDLAPLSIDTTLDPTRAAMLGQTWRVTPDHIRANQAENQLVIPRSILDLRLPQADANTARIFEHQCRRILDRRLARVGVTGQVRSRLLHNPDQWPSMDTVAAELHIDPRTLRRALTKEGASYRALVDEVRHQRAIDMLRLGQRVDEIARQLGYAETANFTHAFKRWEGLAPSHFRNLSGRSPRD